MLKAAKQIGQGENGKDVGLSYTGPGASLVQVGFPMEMMKFKQARIEITVHGRAIAQHALVMPQEGHVGAFRLQRYTSCLQALVVHDLGSG